VFCTQQMATRHRRPLRRDVHASEPCTTRTTPCNTWIDCRCPVIIRPSSLPDRASQLPLTNRRPKDGRSDDVSCSIRLTQLRPISSPQTDLRCVTNITSPRWTTSVCEQHTEINRTSLRSSCCFSLVD